MISNIPPQDHMITASDKAIEAITSAGRTILEFGCGVSTLKLANKCDLLLSIDNVPGRVQAYNDVLREYNIGWAEVLCEDAETYIPEREYDCVFVDFGFSESGAARLAAAERISMILPLARIFIHDVSICNIPSNRFHVVVEHELGEFIRWQ